MLLKCAISDRPLTIDDLPERLPAVLVPPADQLVPPLLGGEKVQLPAGMPSGLPDHVIVELAALLAQERNVSRTANHATRRPGPSGPSPGTSRLDQAACRRLRGFLRRVGDPRKAQGRRYPLDYLLALPIVAMTSGDIELESIGEWAASAPEQLLVALGAPIGIDGRAARPDATTIARTMAEVDGDELDAALCAWVAAIRRQQHPGLYRCLHIDGKALKGAAPRGGKAPMLLAARCDEGTVVAQSPVSEKTNEIPVLRTLLDRVLDLTGVVITADQLHTQRKHAIYLHKRGGHYIFTVGENQPKLFAALDALPWAQIAIEAATAERGHGRIEVRTIRTLPATPAITALFPHAAQVFLLERYLYDLNGTMIGSVAVLGITSLTGEQADPAALAAYVRGHWSVEVLHYVRDVVFREDSSRTRGAFHAMSALRNLVIGVYALRGIQKISQQLRACHRDPYRLPLIILGLMTQDRDRLVAIT